MIQRMRMIGAFLMTLLWLTPAARTAEPEAIRQAIERGVAFLKGQQGNAGSYLLEGPQSSSHWNLGVTALVGLTLLECDVPAKDPVVRRIADYVRQKCTQESRTYTLAACVLFLDRLKDPHHTPLIKTLATRLLRGQTAEGVWSYDCPVQGGEVDAIKRQTPPRPPAAPRRRGRPPLGAPPPGPPPSGNVGLGQQADNSNTQFAILALWAARRHGVSVDQALDATARRLRQCQHADGGWSYRLNPDMPVRPLPGADGSLPPLPGTTSSGSMTCGSLLGLAMMHSVVELRPHTGLKPSAPIPERSDPSRDSAIKAGLLYLGKLIQAGKPQANDASRGSECYFLWSLERVAVAYNLATIGDQDWYAWGSDYLVAQQNNQGAWQGKCGLADTCFALLFLRRANLVREISASLQGMIRDPGKAVLQAQGIGGERLPKKPHEPVAPKPQSIPAAADTDAEIQRLSQALIQASPAERMTQLAKLRDSKGPLYTQALARSIPKLSGTVKQQARDALADRVTRMSSATLGRMLRCEDAEIRRAASLSCAAREDKTHILQLIVLLEDKELSVAYAAHAALKSFSKHDFGPAPHASRAERAQSVAAWKHWWSKQKDK